MAARFLVALRCQAEANADGLIKRVSKSPLARVLHSETILAWAHPSDRPIVLPDASAIVFGNLFHRSDYTPVRDLAGPEGKAFATKGTQYILDRYWGGYVTILGDGLTFPVSVLRDPSGALPCFWTEIDGWVLLASDIELLALIGGVEAQVNWQSVATYLAGNGLPRAETCLEGVQELLAGNALRVSPDALIIEPAWSPWDYAGRPSDLNDRDLAETLRSTVLGCVGAWGRCFTHPLLGVSGGLDSSIVAAALTAHNIPFTAFTMFTDDTEGDERRFARTLASALGFELLEFQHRHNQVNLDRSASARGARPGVVAYGQSNLVSQKHVAAERGIDAFFSGIGGDNVFCLTQSATPLVDRFQSEGISLGLLTTLKDIGKQTGASLTDVLIHALKARRTARAPYSWPIDTRFLTPAAINVASGQVPHNWLRAPGPLPKGKAVHIARLTILQSHSEAFPRGEFGPQIFPLLSQPVVELCLGIPTWKWCAGGQNRAVARNAFADLLPGEIIQRRSKGGPDNFACEVIERNKPQIRELLLGGLLAQNGLVDREPLSLCLSDSRVVHGRDHARIATLCEAEAWTRSWSEPAATTKIKPTAACP